MRLAFASIGLILLGAGALLGFYLRHAWLPECATPSPLTVSLLEVDSIETIVPLGNLNPPAHTFPTSHMYVNRAIPPGIVTNGPFDSDQLMPAVPVFAPGDVVVQEVEESTLTTVFPDGHTETYTEYGLTLGVCGGIVLNLGHLGEPSPKLLEAAASAILRDCDDYATGPSSVYYCHSTVRVPVTAGEEIAVTSGRTHGIDLGAFDRGGTARAFASPGRLWSDEAKYNICPLDLFEPSLRNVLEAKVGLPGQRRTAEPIYDTVDQDVAGTPQGNWFYDLDRPGPEDNNLALVHDNIDPTRPAFSVGNSLHRLPSNIYYFTPMATGRVNREFSEIVADGHVYCFENLVSRNGGRVISEHVVLLLLENEGTLRIEVREADACGPGPWSLTEAAMVYER